jgi:hypothetical protein
MPSFNSLQLIEQLQQQTESFLQKAIANWQNESARRMLQQPAPGKWSAAQCLEHLNTYGRYYLPALQTAIAVAVQKNWKPQSNFKPSWLGNYFTNLMMPKGEANNIVKMKAPKNHRPLPNIDSHAVIAEFIDQQEKLLALLEEAKTVDMRKAKVPISISRFINLPVGDTFRFLIAHNYRHVLQAERALKNAVATTSTV